VTDFAWVESPSWTGRLAIERRPACRSLPFARWSSGWSQTAFNRYSKAVSQHNESDQPATCPDTHYAAGVVRTYFFDDLMAKLKMVPIIFAASPAWSAAIGILGRFPPPENGTSEDRAAPSSSTNASGTPALSERNQKGNLAAA
jgi:hypothetical protein